MASSDLNLEIYKDVKEDLIAKIMDDFEGLLEIDKNLSGRTVKQHTRNIERFLKSVDKPLAKIGKKDIRNWLRKWKEDYAPSTYANKVKSLRVFFRDHLGSDIAENLSMP
ncbi:MAG: phage integrase N-terminal SAM-like domain-containing protein [Candidatus Hadarchaeia archaeon]